METAKTVNNDFYNELGDKWYESDDHPIAILRSENKRKLDWVQKQIPSRSKILDVGTGGGFLTNSLALQGHEVTGIDLSESSLAIAKKNDPTGKVTYKKANADNLPFANGSFDIVSALDLLEHVENPSRVIKEASRVLKPGGIFLFHTFNRNLLSYLFAVKGLEWFTKNAPKNIHLYRLFIKPQEMNKYCLDAKLKVEEFIGIKPNWKKKAFWKLIFTKKISSDFDFELTKSLSIGYLGRAKKET